MVVEDGSDAEVSRGHVLAAKKACEDAQVAFDYSWKANGGPSTARNHGLRLATTDFVAFLDVDDTWTAESLEWRERELFDAGDDYFGAYGSFVEASGHVAAFMDSDGSLNRDSVGRQGGVPGGAPPYLFRRSALISVEGFDERLRYNEDIDLIIRLSRCEWLVRGARVPVGHRNRRPESLTRQHDPLPRYRGVGAFLDHAQREDYFSPHEHARRRKANGSTWRNPFAARALLGPR